MAPKIPDFLYHYTNISSLAMILKNRSIRLSRLDLVDDLSESDSNDSVNYGANYFVTCWTDIEEESIPFWKMYTSDMAGVRIKLPTPIFKSYPLEDNPLPNIFVTDDQGQSVLPLNRLHGENYIVVSEGFNDFFKILYTSDESLLKPKLQSKNTSGGISLAFGKFGKHKRLEWEFQSEWRYRMIIFPSPPPPIKGYDDVDFIKKMESAMARIPDGFPTPFTHFFLNICDESFCKMEITMGPKSNDGDFTIVDSLVKTFNPGASIKYSRLKGSIK